MVATLPIPGGSFTPCPAGSHAARCVGVIDLGTSESTYEGQSRQRRQIMVVFETPLELMEDGQPFQISGWYTWSMADSAKLRGHLESWRGKPFKVSDFGEDGFHISKLLGVPAMITVVTQASGKNKIGSLSPIPKGMTIPPQVNASKFVFLDKDDFDLEAFESLSDRLKEKIIASPEYAALGISGDGAALVATSADVDEGDEGDCPF